MFPKNSQFDDKQHQQSLNLGLAPYDPTTTIGSTKKLNVTEVPNETLEHWYRSLDALTANSSVRTSAHEQSIEELRDEIYSYLRG